MSQNSDAYKSITIDLPKYGMQHGIDFECGDLKDFINLLAWQLTKYITLR